MRSAVANGEYELLPALICVREVLETYRLYGLLLPRWSCMLEASADDIERFFVSAGADHSFPEAVRVLSSKDLSRQSALVREVADEAARLLDGIRVGGAQEPDDHWSLD